MEELFSDSNLISQHMAGGAYVLESAPQDDATTVTFECPVCGETEVETIPDGATNYQHACHIGNLNYPLLPTVSLSDTPLSKLPLDERVDMQLRSVAAAKPFVDKYHTTSLELLSLLPGSFTAITSGAVGMANLLFVAAVFSATLQANPWILGVYFVDVLLLGVGLVSTWRLIQDLQVVSDYVEVYNVDLSTLQFFAAVGNYYERNAFRLWFLDLFFLYAD